MNAELPYQPEHELLMYKASPEEMELLWKRMEEMANQPKEPMGQRQPGERCAYEIQRMEKNDV